MGIRSVEDPPIPGRDQQINYGNWWDFKNYSLVLSGPAGKKGATRNPAWKNLSWFYHNLSAGIHVSFLPVTSGPRSSH